MNRLTPESWRRRLLALFTFALLKRGHGERSIGRVYAANEVVYHRDGKTATVALIRDPNGWMRITTNGKPDAQINVGGGAAAPDEVTMVLLGALPLALHPQAELVANIGMGSGMTTHLLLGSDRIRRVDTVEIEQAGAGRLGDPGGLGRDPAKVRIEVEYLVTAGLSGALAQGQEADVRYFKSWYDDFRAPGQTPPFHLQLLLDHAAIAVTTNPP